MKITVITSSLRVNSNSNAMTEAFRAEAEKNGHTTEIINAAKLDISPCHACRKCYTDGKACVFDNDMCKVCDTIEGSDAVIFAMPVYWFNMPAALKLVIDKFYAFMIGERSISGKKCGLMACCADDDMGVFTAAVESYKRTAALLGWKNIGTVLCAGINDEGDIDYTNAETRAAELAERLDRPDMPKVTADTTMGEILFADPSAADKLIKAGMHCVGCPSSVNESLTEACELHGTDLAKLLSELNS